MKIEIGNMEISNIVELEFGKLLQTFLEDATPQNIRRIPWLFPKYADNAGHLKAVVQSFLIKSENKNILADPCIGNGKPRKDIPKWSGLKTDFLKKLGKFIDPGRVDYVICTHLHCDHVGWNTSLVNGEWKPTFPNAKYIFVKKEYEYWKGMPEKELLSDRSAFTDSIEPVKKAGLLKLVNSDFRLDKHISLIPTPGHTPGHASIQVKSEGRKAIISGDALWHPCQIANPGWTAGGTIPEKTLRSRLKLLNDVADTETIFIGSHFSEPAAGYVKRLGGGFVFKA